MIKPEQCERLTRKARKTLEEYGLGVAADLLLSSSRWGIRLDVSTLDEYRRTGNSRVGGHPDLPSRMEWPLTQEGVPMTFLAQLNLVDLSPYTPNDGRGTLPERGMLYFFVGADESASPIEHRVIFEPSSHNLIRREPEGDTTLDGAPFVAHSVTVLPNLEFPTYAYIDAAALNELSPALLETDETEAEVSLYDRYLEFESSWNHPSMLNWGGMFGYPDGQHPDAEHRALLQIALGEEYDYNEQACEKKLTKYYGGDEDRTWQELSDTLLLLKIDTHDAIGFQWWDCGELQFFIRKSDLEAGRFEQTYCSLYSS
ncbi:YwqG family protein [Paenibacillus amylolyticus]|uniref:YwqG family protein n=1 Tax=Paenibacillus amylolyticus TaxID=1451 RepID=UPI0032428536